MWDGNIFSPVIIVILIKKEPGSLTEIVNYSYQVYELRFKYARLFVNNLQLHLTTC